MTAFDGVVLCGGRSRRMGRDKALVEIDGRPMARRVADALEAAGAAAVVALGGDVEALRAEALHVVADRRPGEGPLGALVHALDDCGERELVAVLACDLVAPDASAIRRLVDSLASGAHDAVVPVVDGRAQWLHGVWRRRVGGVLGAVFAAGERSLVGATAGLSVHYEHEVDRQVFADADRPEDLP